MAKYEIKDQSELNRELEKLTTSTAGHADVFNALFGALLNNDAYLDKQADITIAFDEQTSKVCLKRGDEVFSSAIIEGGIVASLIAVSALEEDLYGQTVTLTSVSSGETQEAAFSEDGVCSFRVRYTGEYILNCGTAEEETVKIRELGTVYDVSMSTTPKSVINVSTEESELYGVAITLTGENGITYEDVFSDTGICTFKVRTLGTYTLRYADEELTVEVLEQGASYDVVAEITKIATVNVTTTDEELYGQAVTCTDGTENLTGIFSASGTCSFTVRNLSTYTVACEGYSTTVNVSEYEQTYSAAITIPKATIKVTASAGSTELYGKTVTCTGGSEALTGTFSASGECSFTVKELAAYTLSCEGYSATATVSAFNTTVSAQIHIPKATINVETTDTSLYGKSVTCVGGDESYTGKFSANGACTFTVKTATAFTITSGNYSDTVTVKSLSAIYSVSFVVNGSTATPLNDVTTWIRCADLQDTYGYTAMSSVLADSACLLALISSENAVKYMVRSTGFAGSICANATAMSYIGANDYCADSLLDNAAWCNAIGASSYWNSIWYSLIPAMTGPTTPSGTVSIENYYIDEEAIYPAFAGVKQYGLKGTVTYTFDKTVKVYKVKCNASTATAYDDEDGRQASFGVYINDAQIYYKEPSRDSEALTCSYTVTDKGIETDSMKYAFTTAGSWFYAELSGGSYGVFGREVTA